MDSSLSSDTGTPSSDSGTEICAPLDAFSVSGTPPAEGDEVEFKVKGKVSRVDGGNAYVTPETVNDQPVMSDSGAPDEGNMDENALRQNAQSLDKQQYASGGVVKDHRVESPNTIEDLYTPNVPFNQYGGKKRGGAPHGA